MSKKILHILPSLDPKLGGVCQAVKTIIKGLAERNIENEVLCMDDPQSSFLNVNTFKVYALGPSKTAWLYSPKLLPWLIKNCNNYEKIIIHGLWTYYVYAVVKVSKIIVSKEIKFYVMPHGMLDPYFQKAPERKFKAFRNLIFWYLFEKKLINDCAEGLLFTCETEKLLAKETFPNYNPKKEMIVSLGVETPPAFKHTMQTAFLSKAVLVNNQNYILFLSRIQQKKGVDILVKTYIALQKEGLRLPYLVIAGPGLETEYGKSIVQMCANYTNIIFTGMLTGDAKWGAFYGCDAFILPSHQENFGIAVVEAMACGKPVLISREVNIYKEIVEEKAAFAQADTFEGTKTLLQEWLNLSLENKNLMSFSALRAYDKLFSIKNATAKLMKSLSIEN